MTTSQTTPRKLRLFIISGEQSGDALGASLVRELRRRGYDADHLELAGVGGEHLAEEGMQSLFPQSDIAVIGVSAVIGRLRLLARRIRETVDAVIKAQPDLLLTIDSPDFAFRVAARVRRRAPSIPIVHWVCPSVWAWRPWRARKIRPYIDRILALLPFEPKALAELNGPKTVFIGHPLIEQLADLRPSGPECMIRDDAQAPRILLLPGSRRSETTRLLQLFGEVGAKLAERFPKAEFVLPTVSHLEKSVVEGVRSWPFPVRVISGHAEKRAAFREARVALAASGTVTLELALSGVPTVAAYRVGAVEAMVARRVVRVPSVILPNLVLESRVVPELLQEHATVSALFEAVGELIEEGARRSRQLQAFAELEDRMTLSPEAVAWRSPSQRAVDEVLDVIDTWPRR